MKGKNILFFIISILLGCTSYSSYSVYSTNEIPIQKRRSPSPYKTILIDLNGPQLNPEFYENIGVVKSNVDNRTVFEDHTRGAIELLKNEARKYGADAIINVYCGKSPFGAGCSGEAIILKDHEQCINVLKDIGAKFY